MPKKNSILNKKNEKYVAYSIDHLRYMGIYVFEVI